MVFLGKYSLASGRRNKTREDVRTDEGRRIRRREPKQTPAREGGGKKEEEEKKRQREKENFQQDEKMEE